MLLTLKEDVDDDDDDNTLMVLPVLLTYIIFILFPTILNICQMKWGAKNIENHMKKRKNLYQFKHSNE